MINKLLYLFIVLFFFQCSSITYKVIRKQNINNLDSYRELSTNNQYFILGILPLERNNYVYTVCKNEEKNKIDFEIKNESNESYPSVIKTKFNLWSVALNVIFGSVYSNRKIYVYCPY